MRKTIITILGALLIAGSAADMAAASARHVYTAPGDQFRNANNSLERRTKTFCSQEPGNPYNERTDYMGWSAWRQDGAWDSRNDC